MMDTNKMRPSKQETNIEASRWKSAEYRKVMVKKILDLLIKQGPPSWAQNLSEIIKTVERFEEKVNASAKDEAEYIAKISTKVKAIYSLPQSTASKLLLSNSSGSGEVFSALGAGRAANIEWQEQVYQKVQRIKNTYFTKLSTLYQQISSKLQQHESAPQEPKTIDLEKFRNNKKVLEFIFMLLRVTKSQITTDFKERLDKAEKLIHSIVHPKNVSSHNQGQHSADVHSMQQFVPSHSTISQVEIFENKPTSQVLSTQNSHLTKQIPQQNKMCLQEQQVAKQYSNSQQEANQLSIIKGPGNAVQHQTHGALKSAEAFSSTREISASPLIEDCSNLNEISHTPTVISDEPSAAMQRLVKVLTSISPEALSASIDEIREVVYLNDAIPMSKTLDGRPKSVRKQLPSLIPLGGVRPPKSVIGTNLAAEIDAYSQSRYLTCNDFVLSGRKMGRRINAMALDTARICANTSDSFNQLTYAEKPDSNSVPSQVKRPRIVENCALLEEIKEINKLLIDTEVVIGEEDIIPSSAGGAAEHGEGLIVKFIFNAVTVNLNLMTHSASHKMSIIKPLWLLVPTSYPFFSPVILDKMPLEVSEDLEDLSMKAKSKLRFSLQSLNQPCSLGDIAMSWERCAREAIREYAQLNGGGTFSSKYEGWEICQNSG